MEINGGEATVIRQSAEELQRLRNIAARQTLVLIATHAKRDVTFQPMKLPDTERWHVNANGHEFELLINGAKFYDTRAKVGGGGAIDLAMHLFQLRFIEAMSFLKHRNI
jgi:hypothetical protein